LITPVPAGEPIKIVFDKYEYANSPAARLAGELVVVERLILIEVFAIIIVLVVDFFVTILLSIYQNSPPSAFKVSIDVFATATVTFCAKLDPPINMT